MTYLGYLSIPQAESLIRKVGQDQGLLCSLYHQLNELQRDGHNCEKNC